jgi:hypothetical protein
MGAVADVRWKEGLAMSRPILDKVWTTPFDAMTEHPFHQPLIVAPRKR